MCGTTNCIPRCAPSSCGHHLTGCHTHATRCRHPAGSQSPRLFLSIAGLPLSSRLRLASLPRQPSSRSRVVRAFRPALAQCLLQPTRSRHFYRAVESDFSPTSTPRTALLQTTSTPPPFLECAPDLTALLPPSRFSCIIQGSCVGKHANSTSTLLARYSPAARAPSSAALSLPRQCLGPVSPKATRPHSTTQQQLQQLQA